MSLDVTFACDTNGSSTCSTLFFTTAQEASWDFTVRFEDGDDNTSNSYADIMLSFRGLYKFTPSLTGDAPSYFDTYSQKNPLLKHMKLTDLETGTEIPALAENGQFTRYIYNQNGQTSRTFRWTLQNAEVTPASTNVIRADSTPQAASGRVIGTTAPTPIPHLIDLTSPPK